MLWHKLIGFAIVSLVLVQWQFVGTDAAVSSCKANFTQVGGKCLQLVNKWYNWYEGDRHCRSLGAGLLSIQNATELQLINNWLNQSYTLEFWTSGNTLGGSTGVYYWQSTGEQARYLPWAPGQPQANSGECLSLYAYNYTTNGSWDYRLRVQTSSTWATIICEQQQQLNSTTESRICLKASAYETAQVLVN